MRWSSPRPWGCFFLRVSAGVVKCVVPTPVGVFPQRTPVSPHAPRRPHARGGVSLRQQYRGFLLQSSPRPWGCFRLSGGHGGYVSVVPTPVGVFPGVSRHYFSTLCRPHARGGCFYEAGSVCKWPSVVPTPVGVFPQPSHNGQKSLGRPHARGGVSGLDFSMWEEMPSSPRPWGCFFRKT